MNGRLLTCVVILLLPQQSPADTNGFIHFVSTRSGDGRRDDFIVKPDGSDPTGMNDPEVDRLHPGRQMALWNLGNKRRGKVAASWIGGPGEKAVNYIIDPDGTKDHLWTDHPDEAHHPVISPDSTHIAFASSKAGQSDIYLFDMDGTNEARLTGDEGEDFRLQAIAIRHESRWELGDILSHDIYW